MAISTEASRSTYAGNGVTTVFSTGFYFLEESEVVVKHTPSGGAEVILTLGVDYDVTMPVTVGGTGSVSFFVPPANGDAVVIERTVPFTQETSFRTQGTFSREVHEDAMDEVVFQTQQLARRISDLESAGAPGSVVAGSGLSFSGPVLHVGAGNGIEVYPDEVRVDYYLSSPRPVGVAASAGASSKVARGDHQHAFVAGIPVSTAVKVGNAVSAGAAATLALSDHQHEVLAAAPVSVTKAANAEGAATTFSRSDHKHDISTAAAVDLTDAANAEGTANTLARSDHTHSHGNRGGGALHSVATPTTAGFMSATDKGKLDSLTGSELRSRVIAAQGSYQSIPTGFVPWTQLIDLTETVDLDSEWSGATYEAKADGYVLVCARVESAIFAWPAGSSVWLAVYKNGALYRLHSVENGMTPIVGRNRIEMSCILQVVKTDTVELYLAHSGGANVDFISSMELSRLA